MRRLKDSRPVKFFQVDATKSRVLAIAKSNVHDLNFSMPLIGGSLTCHEDNNVLRWAGEIEVNTSKADAGDFLRNRKLHKELGSREFPKARFTLMALELPKDQASAKVAGTIQWRNTSREVNATVRTSITDTNLQAEAEFEIRATDFDITPPKILMFKVDDTVSVSLTLYAQVTDKIEK